MNKMLMVLLLMGSWFLSYSQIEQPILISNTNNTYFNPAFAGIEGGSSLSLRSSFLSDKPANKPQFINGLNFNKNIQSINSGIGFEIAHKFDQDVYKNIVSLDRGVSYIYNKNTFSFKANYSYHLKFNENSGLRLGGAARILLNNDVVKYYENNDSKSIYNELTSSISFGTNYNYKSFVLGVSVGNIDFRSENKYRLDIMVNSGITIRFNDKFLIEPKLQIASIKGSGLYTRIQNDFILFEKFNFGAGLSGGTYWKVELDGSPQGVYCFAGVTLKQKLKLNLVYQKYGNHGSPDSASSFWLNNNNFELNCSYKL